MGRAERRGHVFKLGAVTLVTVCLIPMRRLSICSITVKGRAVFQCSICRTFGSGDSVTAEVAHPEEIASIKPDPSAMPIGWRSSSGNDGRGDHLAFKCPNCRDSSAIRMINP